MFLLVSQKELTTKEGSLFGTCVILTCALSWSYGSLFISKADLPKNFFVSTGYQMLTAGIFLISASLALDEVWISPLAWSTATQWSVVLLILFGSCLLYTSPSPRD